MNSNDPMNLYKIVFKHLDTYTGKKKKKNLFNITGNLPEDGLSEYLVQ